MPAFMKIKTGPGPLSTVAVDPLVRRHSKTKCYYECPYYQDGPVFSYCNKYHKALKYDGTIPPLLTAECKADVYNAG